MEFSYSREQQMVKQMLKEFAEREIAPISAEIDEKAEYQLSYGINSKGYSTYEIVQRF